MSTYYSGVEQMDNLHSRCKFAAVTPVLASTGCCITTLYEAIKAGVKTSCNVRDARRHYSDVAIIKAQPDCYIMLHHELLAAIDTAIPTPPTGLSSLPNEQAVDAHKA